MVISTRSPADIGRLGATRRSALAVAALIGVLGVSACGDSAGSETGGVTAADLQEFEDQIDALDQRVGALEENGALPEDIDDESPEAVPDVSDDFFAGSDVYVGQVVTVRGGVSEVVAATDAGTAFRIAGESGDPVLVVSTTPPEGLGPDDVVRVSGTVLVLREDTFEQEFGMAPDEVFDDPGAFFGGAEDQIGIAADDVQSATDEG